MVDILRKGHVQALRAAAKKCKVPLIRDDVGRERVTEFAGAIRDSTGPADQKQSAAAAFEAYELIWPTAVPTPQPPGGWRMMGRSFLLTYNWDFLGRPFKDGTPPAATTAELWGLWRLWKKEKRKS